VANGNGLTIKKIMCPTDLSRGSDEALHYAFALAQAYDAKLIAFHCQTAVENNDLQDDLKASFEQQLFQRLNVTELALNNWERVVSQCDDPGASISDYAAVQQVDLIVMRSRRRPHRAALLGSTAESVCRTAPCPVLLTHSDEREWIAARQVSLKRVLVAYDFSDYAEIALTHALKFAQEYQSELHLLHVLPPYTLNEPELAWYPITDEGPYHKAARRLQKAVPPEAHLWCSVKTAINEGQPYREILNYAERNQIDLICLGAHGSGFGLLTLFGSNVDRVLRQAPCPVLVARPLRHSQVAAATARAIEPSLSATALPNQI
jgi:nucleotide-binding universal stress UspA family protein